MNLGRWCRLSLVIGLSLFSTVSCKTTAPASSEKGLQVSKSDGTHDLYLWVTSKQFNNEVNICLFFNQSWTSDMVANDTRPNFFENYIFKSEQTRAWNSNYIPWTAYRRAMIATAQKINNNLRNGIRTISYTARFADGTRGEKTVAIDANKYAEFVSWFMTDLEGRAPDKVETKSTEIFNYIYAVMDNIDDRDQVSDNQCGKSANKNPKDNVNVSPEVRMQMYREIYGQLQDHLSGSWATGKAWRGWTDNFKSDKEPVIAPAKPATDCNPADPWKCYWNTKKADRPAILATIIRGVGPSTAEKMVAAGAFPSKPKTWDDFKAEIKRLSQVKGADLGDLYDNVVATYGSDNKKNLGF